MATPELLAKMLGLPEEERARLALELLRSFDGWSSFATVFPEAEIVATLSR